MNVVPAALILINENISDNTKDWLERQLFIDITLDGYVFDDLVTANPDYPDQVRKSHQRIMVLKNFQDTMDRSMFDIVGYVDHGLIAVEINKFGPPGLTFKVLTINWPQLFSAL